MPGPACPADTPTPPPSTSRPHSPALAHRHTPAQSPQHFPPASPATASAAATAPRAMQTPQPSRITQPVPSAFAGGSHPASVTGRNRSTTASSRPRRSSKRQRKQQLSALKQQIERHKHHRHLPPHRPLHALAPDPLTQHRKRQRLALSSPSSPAARHPESAALSRSRNASAISGKLSVMSSRLRE